MLWDLKEIKRKIDQLPPEQRAYWLRKYPHLAAREEELPALISPEEEARIAKEIPMDGETKLYRLVEKIEKLCRERGELSLAEVERIALEQGIRASAVLEDMSISEDITIDLAGGKIRCR